MSALLDSAGEAIDWIRGQAPSAEAEVYVSTGREAGIEFKDGRPELSQVSHHAGTGLRLILDGRQGFAYAAGASARTVRALYGRVRRQLGFLAPDANRRLPGPGSSKDDPELRRSLIDPEILERPLSDRIEMLREMEAEALKADKRVKRALRSGYGEGRGEVAIANSRGLAIAEEGTHCSVGLAITAGEGAELQVGSASDSKRHSANLDWTKVAADAAERGAVLLDGRKLPPRRRSVLLDPWVSGEFLDLLTGALGADLVQRGKSMLEGKLGRAVASDIVTFRDNPRIARGAASSLFDDEGVDTRAKTMIEKGILKEFFYDCYTAARDDRDSNGSAVRASFRGLPRPENSNFYLEPGTWSREKLIGDTTDGVLVFEVLGMHTADPITGEFSVGISGIAIENGRLTHGVKGGMISGGILELLEKVDAVADDLVFYGGVGTPTFRARDISVA